MKNNFDKAPWSLASRALQDAREAILNEWLERVRVEIPAAAHLSHAVLIDTLPAFLDKLIDVLTEDHPVGATIPLRTIAHEHGGERARITQLNTEDIIREYQLLREIIIFQIKKRTELDEREKIIIYDAADLGLREAVTAHALIKMELQEQYNAGVVHDLRAPVNFIRMAVIKCIENTEKSETKDLLNQIFENVERAERMVRLLTSSRWRPLPDLNLSRFDMFDLIQKIVQEQKLVIGERVEMKGSPVIGFWDHDCIRRAIENLISNAVRFGDSQKPVSVSMRSEHERLMLIISFEGSPIPIEDQEKIFQIFRRKNKDGRQLWGVGLAFVRQAAEAHGGSISVDSAYGRPTTFLVDIPVDTRPFVNNPAVENKSEVG